MKLRYQLATVLMVIGLGVLTIALTGCGNMNQGSDEYGEITYSTYSDCYKGILCRSDTQLECYPPQDFYDAGKGMVCANSETYLGQSSKPKSNLKRAPATSKKKYKHKLKRSPALE
jgi:hypothetical protein